MGLSQQMLNDLFPGNTGISVPFGTVENVGNYHGTEQGVDIGYGANGAGTPVQLVSSGIFEGSVAAGYAAIFKSDVSGKYEYYQHIEANPNLKVGVDYPYQTPIGTIAPADAAHTPSGYSSSGPHLEFGIATGPPGVGAEYPSYANLNPIPVLISDANNLGKDLIGSDQGVNLTTNTQQTPSQIINNENQPTVKTPTDIITQLIPSSIGAYITLTLLGLGAIVLVYALVKGHG